MKIQLKKQIYDEALADGRIRNKLDLSRKSKLTYPTIMSLASGEHSVNAYKILGQYCDGLGINMDELSEMKFGDIFQVS